MEEKTIGAWVVHHTGKLQGVTNAGDFERIQSAGKAGILLSGLSADAEVVLPKAKVQAIAKAAGINTIVELPGLLKELQDHRLIDQSAGGDVNVLGIASSAVLTHTAKIYASLEPTGAEQAAIALAEQVSNEPVPAKRAAQSLSDEFKLSEEDVSEVLKSSEQIGFTDFEDVGSGSKLYFNGHLFRRGDAQKMAAIMASLKSDDERRIRELEAKLKAVGCVEIAIAKTILGDQLFEKMNSIGMYDLSQVANDKETVAYVTRPGAFSKYGDSLVEDAMDLAKAFVASLTYGMQRRTSDRGRIAMIEVLLRKLINGGRVGPATAIGQDYAILEFKRVVELERAEGTKYYMRLLKKEVGELALQVITSGDVSEASLPGFSSAPVSRYVGPERNREIARKKQNEPSRKAVARIIQQLRTGGGL